MIRIGVDHGMTGGMAILKDMEVLHAWGTPVIGDGATRMLDFAQLEERHRIATSLAAPGEEVWWVVERVHSMPKQGVASTFTFGRIVGQMEAFMHMSGTGAKHCTPYQWKSAAGMTRTPKHMSPGLCAELVPSSRRFLAGLPKVKILGIADAILIARFGWH